MEAAAEADVFGGGMGWQLLTATDPFVVAVIQRKTREAAKIRERLDKNLANMVGNNVARAIGGKRGKR